MSKLNADIIAALQQEIISLETPTCMQDDTAQVDLGSMNASFPNFVFPTAAIHEFISTSNEDGAATAAFVSSIVAALIKNKSTAIWISQAGTIFPPALNNYGIAADKIIFIQLQKEKEILWATEAALKCESIAAVIAEIPALDFTTSRRLQLAVEKSKVTGFILRQTKNKITPTACISRWHIQSLPSETNHKLPGVGFPKWNIHLVKIKNGKPGKWEVGWVNRQYHFVKEGMLMKEQDKIAV